MNGWRLVHIDEPQLAFGFAQKAEHPKDGLFLFGPPASSQNPARMDIGVIGTERAVAIYESWVQSIQTTIPESEQGKPENKMMWPGFQAVFGIPWPSKAFAVCKIDGANLSRRIRGADRHEAIYKAVDLYEETLRRYLREEEARPQLWYAIVPEEIFRYGRPQSRIPLNIREPAKGGLGKRTAQRILREGSLFSEEVQAAAIYEYELNFHNQLKARLLDTKQVIQVVRETTLAPLLVEEDSRRSLQDPASVAWNLATTSFYKAGGRPWRIADIREDVCYVGLVYKRIENGKGGDNACCGAQMFLSSGDGVVFKGAVGPWYSEANGQFQLSKEKAAKLMEMIVESYKEMHGHPPAELFIHGKAAFGDEEWAGFSSTVPEGTKLVGVRIKRQTEIKLFRFGERPVLRGTAMISGTRKAYLWSVGFTPRLNTYPGREVPNPLTVDIVRGEAEIERVLIDLLALTKLNFNNAEFSDGLPVTLRFADLVGEILTAGPTDNTPPLPFKYYI